MMQQPGNPARDNEPVSGGDAEDAGSVVSEGRSASDDLYARAAADLGILYGPGHPYDPGTAPLPVALTAGATVFTDRVTGATFPEDDEGQTFPDVLARAARLYGIPEEMIFGEADVRRMYEQACMTEVELREELGLNLEANEELMRSTRAEFDPSTDPLPMPPPGCGDAMRWSPPSEGEETPPCPA